MTYIESKSDDTETLSQSYNLEIEYIKSIKYPPTDSLFPTTPTEDLSSINDG